MKRRRKRIQRLLPSDPWESAKLVGLRYVDSDKPGIRRKKVGKGFVYIGIDGQVIRDKDELKRIRALVIPPAWNDVWICASPKGHIQAVGRDARGRKQYRYHPLYRNIRDLTKFGRLTVFVRALPLIRRVTKEHLRLPGLPKEKVLAACVRLLEMTGIRIGNDEYARENASFGLTTLRNRHVQISGHTLKFRFRGKSGQEQVLELSDRRLAKIVRQCQDLPGYSLFEYLDDNGEPQKVDSEDVNNYLREITGEEFTAKDFRTWAGTLLASQALLKCGDCDTQAASKKAIVAAIKEVAGKLGNRPATCRKYYVHPVLLDSYMQGVLVKAMDKDPGAVQDPALEGLQNEEVRVLWLLEEQYKAELAKSPAQASLPPAA